jgi:5-methylcytosine-specific restriction protein A
VPSTPKNTKCRELGCKNNKTFRSAFCQDHGGGITEKGRENQKLYSSSYWQQKRKQQLSKHPLCAKCLLEGKVVQAEHIDHVFPHRQDSNKFKQNLFQSLCPPCHTLKTQDENQGIYTHYTHDGIKTYTDADYGIQITNQAKLAEDL